MKPLISVIIPNFNHAPYLKQRIDSVLSQTYDNLEVILLDDCLEIIVAKSYHHIKIIPR